MKISVLNFLVKKIKLSGLSIFGEYPPPPPQKKNFKSNLILVVILVLKSKGLFYSNAVSRSSACD